MGYGSQVREQHDGLASLVTRCTGTETAVASITSLVDYAIEHTKDLTGFGFGVELLTCMGLGSVDPADSAATPPPSKSKNALRIRSPPPASASASSTTANSGKRQVFTH